MSLDYMGPFREAVLEMVDTMIGVPCAAGPESTEVLVETNVSGTVSLRGVIRGQICLCFPRKSAIGFVGAMLGMEEDELDDETVADGVGEMANIVAGRAKAIFAERESAFDISLPTITTGGPHEVALFSGEKYRSQLISTELGDFALTLWLASKSKS